MELRHGLVFVEPCYYLRPILESTSTIIDCGLGCDANFSQALISRFGVTAIGVDPTHRHRRPLEEFESRSAGHFVFMPFAIGAEAGRSVFLESEANESGSLYNDHANIRRDPIVQYEVEVMTLRQVLGQARDRRVDLLKLDVEGAEYGVLDATPDDVIEAIPQIVIEFHHKVVDRWHHRDTKRLVRRLRALGYLVHSRDLSNYLFFRPAPWR